jgi:uncharacterized protein (DUF885 family)
MMRSIAVVLFTLLWTMAFAQGNSSKQQLDRLIADEWEYELRSSPEMATFQGDHRYDDLVTDYSLEALRARTRAQKDFLERARAIQGSGLAEADRLNLQLLSRSLSEQIEEAPLEPWAMMVSQFGGPHVEYAELAQNTIFRNTEDYVHYIARLKKLPHALDQITAVLRYGMNKKLMPPAYLLPEVARQAATIAEGHGEASPFATPLKRFPDSVSEADRQRIRSQMLQVIDSEVVPSYLKLAAFLKDEYAPHGRKEPGVWSLPNGDERYRLAIRRMTTTNLTPEQIHQTGLEEIARVEKEMLAIAQKMGFKDLASFHESIRNNRSLYGTSGEQILGLYKSHLDEISKDLRKEFGRLPKTRLEVVPMAAYRAGASVPADYGIGTPDGSRPGHVNVNMTSPDKRLLLNLEAIAYHEGLPGHHLQLSLQQEMTSMPEFRKHSDYTAFVEGWALYSEQLAKELGYYKDPYSDYGRLENEMWRAIRLVVDTGVHSQHWSRQQMVDYFRKYTAMDEPNIQTEVDRYIAWPGQALAYKVGQMTILRIRAKATKRLGPRFDIRAFHDEVLGQGALPMDVLEARMDTWIDNQTKQEHAAAK